MCGIGCVFLCLLLTIRCRWGKPIDVEAFAIAKTSETSESIDSREVIRALSAEIEKRMLDLTINAPDW